MIQITIYIILYEYNFISLHVSQYSIHILYFNFNNTHQDNMTQAVLQRKVALIGCGPVGLLGSLLL